MKIKRSSIWYNLMIFPYEDHRENIIRNVCKFFWFTLFNTLIWFVILPIFLGTLFGIIIASVISSPLTFLLILTGLGIFILIVILVFKISESELFAAFKEKHCPRIEYYEVDK